MKKLSMLLPAMLVMSQSAIALSADIACEYQRCLHGPNYPSDAYCQDIEGAVNAYRNEFGKAPTCNALVAAISTTTGVTASDLGGGVTTETGTKEQDFDDDANTKAVSASATQDKAIDKMAQEIADSRPKEEVTVTPSTRQLGQTVSNPADATTWGAERSAVLINNRTAIDAARDTKHKNSVAADGSIVESTVSAAGKQAIATAQQTKVNRRNALDIAANTVITNRKTAGETALANTKAANETLLQEMKENEADIAAGKAPRHAHLDIKKEMARRKAAGEAPLTAADLAGQKYPQPVPKARKEPRFYN